MRKVLTIMLSLVVLVSFAACGEDKLSKEVKANENAPQYGDSGREFTIGMWCGIPDKIYSFDENGMIIQGSGNAISDENFLKYYEDIASAGFTMAFPGYSEMQGGSASYNNRCLASAEAVGIKQLISDRAVKDYVNSAIDNINSVTTEEIIVMKVREMIEPYKKYKSFAGFMMWDEPSEKLFDRLSYAQKIMKKADHEVYYYVNLFPMIAGGSLLGGVTYDAYIDSYLEKFDLPFLSYDHYPLKKDGLEESFLANMEIIKGKVKDKEIWSFLQSISYGNAHRELVGESDTSFQVNSFLAYGGMGIEWFCYWSPPGFDGATLFKEGVIGRDGKKTKTYEYVKQTNLETLELAKVYTHFDWKGVMINDVNGGDKNFEYLENITKEHDVLNGISSPDDLVVGLFKDKNGRDGFMVVNFTDPINNIKQKVSLDFPGKEQAMIIQNGVTTYREISKNGRLTIELNSGEGAFVIPY